MLVEMVVVELFVCCCCCVVVVVFVCVFFVCVFFFVCFFVVFFGGGVRFICYSIDSFPYCGGTCIQFYKFIRVRLLS